MKNTNVSTRLHPPLCEGAQVPLLPVSSSNHHAPGMVWTPTGHGPSLGGAAVLSEQRTKQALAGEGQAVQSVHSSCPRHLATDELTSD